MRWKRRLFKVGLLLAITLSPATAQSVSELLEKGIYTEETVGNLGEAVKIYQEVVAQATASRKHAAQAQYRLAVCYSKMGQSDQAAQAVEDLIKQYPDEKEWITKARQLSPGAGGLPLATNVPWVDGEQLQLTAKLATGLEIGAFVVSAHTDQLDGHDVWRFETQRHIALNAPNMGLSRAFVDRTTFQPRESLFRHSILGTIETNYLDNEAQVHNVAVDGTESSKTLKLDSIYYDNEQGMYLFRQLPLKVGYKVDVPIFSPIGEGPISIGLEVVSKETVSVPAGEFECLKVDLDVVQQTFWYSADEHRYLVKFEAGGVNVQLNEIRTNSPGEMVTYRNDQFDFRISAPTEWFLIAKPDLDGGDEKKASYVLLDPEAVTMTSFKVQDKKKLDEDHQRSVRGWADAQIANMKEAVKEYTVREDSWRELAVGGQPAISYVADFKLGRRNMVEYCVYSIGDTNCVIYESKMEDRWLDDTRAALDSIITTYRTD